MEVSVIGKALTPISHEYLSNISCDSRDSEFGTKQMYLPLPRHYSEIKSMQFVHKRKRHGERHEDLKFERPKFSIMPDFQNMSLAETYNFARAQLKQAPIQNYKPRQASWTPTLSFPKVDRISCPQLAQNNDKNSEVLKSDPIVSSGGNAPENSLPLAKTASSAEREKLPKSHSSRRWRAKSAYGHKKLHRKSSRRRKKSPITVIKSVNMTCSSHQLPNGLTSPRQTSIPLPTKLQPSSPSVQNTLDQKHRLNVVHGNKRTTIQRIRDNTSRLPANRTSRRINEIGLNDCLLSSLDSSLNTKEKCPGELSMRIQLIHRYGNEDIIGKHAEMKRKQEAAHRHEKKNLEQQANERIKEIQRSKIYALNNLMTRLEQKQFEEYKQNL